MEKTVFLFRRHPERSPEDFARHYTEVHAVLGRQLTRCLLGYTVNIVQSGAPPEAITEHWVRVAGDLFDPEVAYASMEDYQVVVDDDDNLFDGFDLYIVDEEQVIVAGEPLDAPIGEVTPECKVIWLYPAGHEIAPPPIGACRVVDNRVRERWVVSADGMLATASDISVIRMAWAPELEHFGGLGSDARVVKEYRQIPAPEWNSERA